MRLEVDDFIERVFEISLEAHRAIVNKDMRRRLSPCDRGHVGQQSMLLQPSPNLEVMARCEYDDVKPSLGQRLQKASRARSRFIPMIGVLPSSVGIQHPVQIDADDGPLGIFQVDAAGLRGHDDHTTISQFSRAEQIMTTTDHRKAAEDHLNSLVAEIQTQPQSSTRERLLAECAALRLAIQAFHMEGIRFRMFNVDRLITRGDGEIAVTDTARRNFSDVRAELEAAGFHTRSHQAPS